MRYELPPRQSGPDDGIRVIALGLHGHHEEAVAALTRMTGSPKVPLFKTWTESPRRLARSARARDDRGHRDAERLRDLR
jgi:hypothetical protein